MELKKKRAKRVCQRVVRDCKYCGKRLVRKWRRANMFCGPRCMVLNRCTDTDQPDACWIWQGPLGKRSNVGQINTEVNGTSVSCRPERIMYLLEYGPVPKGLEVVSICRMKCCCNPQHLGLQGRGGNLGRRPKQKRAPVNHRIVRRVEP